MSPFLAFTLIFFSVFFVVLGLRRKMAAQVTTSVFEQRMQSFREQSAMGDITTFSTTDQNAKKKGLIGDIADWVETSLFSSRGGQSILNNLEEQLVLAGHPNGWHAGDFAGRVVAALAVVICIGGYSVQSADTSPLLYVALIATVARLPFTWLKGQVQERKQRAFSELRDFLDQLILNLTSQASVLDRALEHAIFDKSAGTKSGNRVLVTEFRQAFLESEAQSRTFEDAYRSAAARIGVDQVDALVDLLVQGHVSGSPVIGPMEQMREQVQRLFNEEVATATKKLDNVFTGATVLVMVGCALNVGAPVLSQVMRALTGV